MAELGPGEVGFIIAGIKAIADCKVGDTITDDRKPAAEMLAGFKPGGAGGVLRPVPGRRRRVRDLREIARQAAPERLLASISRPRSSAALGFGFRCGFLGLLHLEIVQERLEREFNLDLVTTAPSVVYKITMTDGNAHRAAQSGRLSRPDAHRGDGGAVDQGHHHDAGRASRFACSRSARSAAASRSSSPMPARAPWRSIACR